MVNLQRFIQTGLNLNLLNLLNLEVYMKRVISIILTILIVFNITCISAFAAESYVVSASDVIAPKNAKVSVPVELKNNKGIMGFKMTVEYNPENVDITSVERGSVTSNGNFTTNFGTLGTKFDVVWNDVNETSEDGSLFILTVICKKSDNIKLTFSQQDTFNEKYEDVHLKCNDIAIKYSAKSKDTTVTTKQGNSKESTVTRTDTTVNNSQILKAIRTTLSDYGYKSLNDVKNEKQFIKSFNKNLSKIAGTNEYKISDIKELKKIYVSAIQGEYVKEASNNIGGEDINNAISASLKKINAKSVDDIPENQKSQFVKSVENELQEKDPNLPSLSNELSVSESFDVIKDLDFNSPKQTEDNSSESSEMGHKKHNTVLYIVLAVCVLIAVAVIVLVIVKKKCKKSE